MLLVPNVPADDVPEGLTDADNVVIKTWGEIPRFDFPLRDHVEWVNTSTSLTSHVLSSWPGHARIS